MPTKGPSMRWDEANKLQVLAQNPGITCDVDKIAESWVGDIKPTPRAVRNTFGDLRGQAFKNMGGKAPATPSVRKPSASTGSNKRKIDANDADDDDEGEKLEVKKRNNKDSHVVNPKQFKKRLSVDKPSISKKMKRSSDDEEEMSTASSSAPEDDENDQVTSADRRGSARQSKSTTSYIQVDGNSSEDDKKHGRNDQEDDDNSDDDFDPAAHRQAAKREKGDKNVKSAVEMTWEDVEI